ncbi:hypothetical protein HA402_007463 [Bradysia odoriphaga]|nr:hypothetical protein HA402_007463 [Bradysia odoriphaga]
MRITTGVHSPAQFRVLGPLSNMRDFATDFNCPEGSMMNPDLRYSALQTWRLDSSELSQI